IITNGNNYLKVYLDNVLVYESNNLDLQMPSPFNAFLEPQTSYAGQMLDGTYKDYYATSDENIKVTNNPPLADSVKLVDPAGKVIASAPVASGTAILDIGKNHMPLNASSSFFSSFFSSSFLPAAPSPAGALAAAGAAAATATGAAFKASSMLTSLNAATSAFTLTSSGATPAALTTFLTLSSVISCFNLCSSKSAYTYSIGVYNRFIIFE